MRRETHYFEGLTEGLIHPDYQVDRIECPPALPPDLPEGLGEVLHEDDELKVEVARYIREREIYIIKRVFELGFMTTWKKPRYIAANFLCLARLFAPQVFEGKVPSYRDLARVLGMNHKEAVCARMQRILERLRCDYDEFDCDLPQYFEDEQTVLGEERDAFRPSPLGRRLGKRAEKGESGIDGEVDGGVAKEGGRDA